MRAFFGIILQRSAARYAGAEFGTEIDRWEAIGFGVLAAEIFDIDNFAYADIQFVEIFKVCNRVSILTLPAAALNREISQFLYTKHPHPELFAQINPAHIGIGDDFFWQAFLEHPSVMDDIGAVDDFQRRLDVMVGD